MKGGGRNGKEVRRSGVAVSQAESKHPKVCFFSLMISERVFVEAYAHTSGCRTRPRLRLRLRNETHKKWGLVPGENILQIEI